MANVRDRRGGNWSWFHNAIIDQYGTQVGAYGVAVYICLCRHTNSDEETWVSQSTIARELGCSRASVIRAIASLKETALIDVEEHVDQRGRHTNTYTLLEIATDTLLLTATGVSATATGLVAHSNSPTINKTKGTRIIDPILEQNKQVWRSREET